MLKTNTFQSLPVCLVAAGYEPVRRRLLAVEMQRQASCYDDDAETVTLTDVDRVISELRLSPETEI